MTKIYDQHKAAFANVSAYVVLHDGYRVATIAFKHPKDGAGRLYAYIHWIGLEMVRGHANGYGYDKGSAACESAMTKLINTAWDAENDRTKLDAFIFALTEIGGSNWNLQLEKAGFTVYEAV